MADQIMTDRNYKSIVSRTKPDGIGGYKTEYKYLDEFGYVDGVFNP